MEDKWVPETGILTGWCGDANLEFVIGWTREHGGQISMLDI